MSLYQLQVFADYHQFYVWDAGVGPSAPDDYTDADIRRLVKVAPNVVVVQPLRNMTVPVDVEVHASEPGLDEGPWDHIVECSLDLPTGRLQIHECTGPDRLNLSVAPGTYAIRVLFAGLDSLSDDGLDGFDRYRIDLWPAPARELRVVNNGTRVPADLGAHLVQPETRSMTTYDTLFVVIDAQRAFVDPAGSLAQAYGIDEVRPSIEALARLRAHLVRCDARTRCVFVRSEYRPGQFTDGRLDDPLSDLCVPGRNVDCEWADGLDTTRATTIITKRQMDAGEADGYRGVVERAVEVGARQIVLTGFQLTTCVRASALTTMALLSGSGTRVVVAEALAGARASGYVQTATSSRVEATCRELRAAGVALADDLDWAFWPSAGGGARRGS